MTYYKGILVLIQVGILVLIQALAVKLGMLPLILTVLRRVYGGYSIPIQDC